MTVYLVTFEGLLYGEGIMTYLLGVYDDENKAIEAKELFDSKYEDLYGAQADIQPVKMNYSYESHVDDAWGIVTNIFLGGYTV